MFHLIPVIIEGVYFEISLHLPLVGFPVLLKILMDSFDEFELYLEYLLIQVSICF